MRLTSSWRFTTNTRPATPRRRARLFAKRSMNFAGQTTPATLAPGAYREIQGEIRASNGSTGTKKQAASARRFGRETLPGRVNPMEEGRKRVLGIIAGILVARHLKTTEDLHDSRPSPRTESLVASAVQWAERIMKRIDGTFANSADDKRWPRA